jgi:protein gp37
VIVGGESGPGARPLPSDWARGLRDQCRTAAVPFFFKQWGESAPLCQLPPDALASWEIRNGVGYPASTQCRVGKKAAGRELDGRTWDEYPQAVAS